MEWERASGCWSSFPWASVYASQSWTPGLWWQSEMLPSVIWIFRPWGCPSAAPPTRFSHVWKLLYILTLAMKDSSFSLQKLSWESFSIEVRLQYQAQYTRGSELAKESIGNANLWKVSTERPGFIQTHYLPSDGVIWKINFLLKYKIIPESLFKLWREI